MVVGTLLPSYFVLKMQVLLMDEYSVTILATPMEGDDIRPLTAKVSNDELCGLQYGRFAWPVLSAAHDVSVR